MVLNELLTLSSGELVKSVEVTGEITLVGLESLGDSGHDLDSLLVGDTWSKSVVGEVTADTDTGGVDHSSLILWEWWAVELGGVHVGDVLGVWAVLVVVLNNEIEELGELLVGVVGTSVGTDAGVDVLAARENALLEGDTFLVLEILVLVPNFLGEESGNGGLVVLSWELWEVLEVILVLEPWTASGDTLLWCWLLKSWAAVSAL